MTPTDTPAADMAVGSSVVDNGVAPVQDKGGAPVANRNRIHSGLQSFVLGRYPPGCSYISKHGHLLRRQLRSAVTAKHSSTSVWSEALIASAVQHEMRRLLLLRWLRLADDPQTTRKSSSKAGLSVSVSETRGLSVMERVSILDRIGAATDARDRCLKNLQLDERQTADPWAALKSPAMFAAVAPPAATLAGPATQATAADAPAVENPDAPTGP
jgi:hypothetical protein